MTCKQKRPYQLCNGREYCINHFLIGNDIGKWCRKSKAYSDMAREVKNGNLESYDSYEKLMEKSEMYEEKSRILKKNKRIIEVFCMGDV